MHPEDRLERGGGSGADIAWAVAVHTNGEIYMAGETLSANLPKGFGTNYNTYGGGNGLHGDAFIAKMNNFGTILYRTYVGGNTEDAAFAVAVDGDGDAYLAGYTRSANFPTANAISNTISGSIIPGLGVYPQDAFVAKLNPAGSQLLYSSYLGGTGDDVGYGLDIDSSGAIYVTGQTSSDNFPVKGAWQPARADFVDVFVARLDPTKIGAASLVYSSYLGGNGSENSYGIAVDSARNAYITGTTGPVALYEFPTTASIGSNDSTAGIFITKFSPNPTQRVHLPLLQR